MIGTRFADAYYGEQHQSAYSATLDTVSYERSDQAVNIAINSYGSISATGGHAEGDTFFGIEAFRGSSKGDIFSSAHSATVRFEGMSGDDILNGGSGNDFLYGGDDNDILNGGAGSDHLDGGTGTNTAIWLKSWSKYQIWTETIGGSLFYKIKDRGLIYDDIDTVINIQEWMFDTQLLSTADLLNKDPTKLIKKASFLENVGGGQIAYQVEVVDGNEFDEFTFNATYNTNLFDHVIDGRTFSLITKANVVYDYEMLTGHHYDVNVTIADSYGSFVLFNEDLMLENVYEAPTEILIGGDWAIEEDLSNGRFVGAVSVVHESGTTLTYSLLNDDGGRFEIDQATGQVRVKEGVALAFAENDTHRVYVMVDDGTTTLMRWVDIAVVPTSPTGLAWEAGSASILDDVAAGVLVGIVKPIDARAGTYSYSLTNDAGGRFVINAATGAISIATGASFDHEVAGSHQIVVETTEYGIKRTDTLTVTVLDGNDAPSNVFWAGGGTVLENAEAPALVGTLGASDPDQGDTFTYTLVGGATNLFEIAGDGLFAKVPLDYEQQASHTVLVRATDADGAYTERELTIAVINVSGETIVGTANGETLTGTHEDETILGLGGNDTLIGNAGGDVLNGGDGVDTVSYLGSDAGVVVNLLLGTAAGGHAAGDTFVSIESIAGSGFGDTLTGTNGANTINGGAGNDVIHGLTGNDILNGGDGDDTIAPGAGVDTSDGGAGNDTLDYSGYSQSIDFDMQTGVLGEAVPGGYVTGERAYNFENFRGTDVTINGRADTVRGTAGNNVFHMGGGNDLIYGRGGADYIDGGDGSDTVYYDYANASQHITVNLTTGVHSGEAADDTLVSIENVVAGAGNDTLVGNAAANTLRGGAGNDILMGMDGDDILDGGDGDDILDGGVGKNTLGGGAGNNTFIAGAGEDTISGTKINIDYSQADAPITFYYDSYSNWALGSGSIAQGDKILGSGNTHTNLVLSAFDDRYQGPQSYLTIHAGDGNDTLIGGPWGGATFYGEDGDDILIGGGNGGDQLYGGSGFDWLSGGPDTYVDTLDFGADGGGLDFRNWNTSKVWREVTVDLEARTYSDVNGNHGNNDILIGDIRGAYGTLLNDTIHGSSGNDKLFGGGGIDTIYGRAGDDYVEIAGGTAFGDGGQDTLRAMGNNVTLHGGDEADVLLGYGVRLDGTYDSWSTSYVGKLYGGAGADVMRSGMAADTFYTLGDGDTIYGTSNDTLSFELMSGGAFFDASSKTGQVTLFGTVSKVVGSAGNDEFIGGGSIAIFAGAGNDLLWAGSQVGSLIGEAGNDVFIGNHTNSSFSGGDGDDYFVTGTGNEGIDFGTGNDTVEFGFFSGRDTVVGFTAGAASGDLVVLPEAVLIKQDANGNDYLKSFTEFMNENVIMNTYNNRTEIKVGTSYLQLHAVNKANLTQDDFAFV